MAVTYCIRVALRPAYAHGVCVNRPLDDIRRLGIRQQYEQLLWCLLLTILYHILENSYLRVLKNLVACLRCTEKLNNKQSTL